MHVIGIGPTGRARLVVRHDDGTDNDPSPLTDDIDGVFLSRNGLAQARDAVAAGRLLASIEVARTGPPAAGIRGLRRQRQVSVTHRDG